jgi:threonine dehydratase
MELFTAQPQLDLVLVPIGQGSGMCGAVAARNALGLKTHRRRGLRACAGLQAVLRGREQDRVAGVDPHRRWRGLPRAGPGSLEVMLSQVDEVAVTDEEVMDAMKLAYIATHNVAEGAGACAIAAALQIRTPCAAARSA